ncbi:uncharacterized protein NECHADRAFT_55741 [Fusarium vanettenii 77-13-4]|uniref:Glycosyltransferase family 32 protein n=1 Tax=Fusarium vanettenii (strain ATCC MYA-4622 / CBS 123669 / FGSC 9596 / NRRL 45880 / 77-13-4) TaxID=660122 RepID=C7ZJK3_FUSV7|nr:uncharacterized protein NECHADRAFT_55741 [Fusarium vanettenii 77-13-4]EEU35805.1 hypothetical protein NECHADRAFT_55741 [Fusarium vanettenii 77-13-4]
MITIWQYLRRLATSLVNYDAPYDEERLEWEPRFFRGWSRKYLKSARLGRAAVYLLLIDLVIFGLLLHTLHPLITLLRRNEVLFRPQVTLTRHGTPRIFNRPDRYKVPRILHQTCANETIPDAWVHSQRSCINAYSDFEYKLWTDERARDFLSSEYPWFLDTWDNYAFPIQRADSIRYFVLYHYGGIYLDMDTFCNEAFPIHQIESDTAAHTALFEATLPTGVTNDFMISSVRHPAFAAAISQLPGFHRITRLWARLQPYCAIMISSGPLFLSLVVEDYLLVQPLIPSPTVKVISSSQLIPYMTDLESATWHREDAQAFMWLGDKPWAWFGLGVVGLVACIYVLNRVLLVVWRAFLGTVHSTSYLTKVAKLL